MTRTAQITEQGYISSVRLVTLGSLLARKHAQGATVIEVEDASDFSEDGGELSLTYYTGETFEFVYTHTDVDADLIYLDAPLPGTFHDRDDFVSILPITTEKIATVTLADADESISARVPHNLSGLIDDGVRQEYDQELVIVTLVDDEWIIDDLLGADPQYRSVGFEEGEDGWELSRESAQFPNANVIDTLGADRVSTRALTLNDADLGTSLTQKTRGLTSYLQGSESASTALVNTTETMLWTFSPGPLKANRVYRIVYKGFMTNNANADDLYGFALRYTFDSKTTPLNTSNPGAGFNLVLPGSRMKFEVGHGGEQQPFYWETIYSPQQDYDSWIGGLTLVKLRDAGGANPPTGTGRGQVKNDDPEYRFLIYVEDMGVDGDWIGTLSQKSKITGTADPDPISAYERFWESTWSASYDGDSKLRQGAENTTNLFQGEYSAERGLTRSLIGFDDANIRSTLAGATIKSVKLKFRVKHAHQSEGVDVRLRAHNYAAKPSTFPAPSVAALASADNAKEGSWVTVTLPTSFGNDLKNNVAKGLSLYSNSLANNFYGYLYGAGSSSPPVLSITFTL